MSDAPKKPLGRILLQQKALTHEQLEEALGRPGGGRLASKLTEQGAIRDVDALKALSEQHGIPGIDLSQLCLKLDDLDLLPREIAEKHLILPVLVRDDRLFIAMANPSEKKVIDELEFVTGKRVYPYVALSNALEQVIEAAYGAKRQGEAYYVGPRCPPEVLRKVGLLPDDRPKTEPPVAFMPEEQEAPLAEPGVVVDDASQRFSEDAEVSDADFGDLSRELSVVTDLPGQEQPSRPIPEDARTVLVVDDEEDIRKLLKRLLGSRGYRVLEADRGLLALRLVKEHAPDLIVLDAMLPEVHGFDIARRIKGSQRYGHIPIIMVSAVYRGWRYAEDLKESCGVDHFIEKPFKIAEVLAAVETSLARRSAPENAPAEADRSGDVSARAEEALNAGVAAYKEGRLDEAVAHLKRGLALDPLAYRLHFHLGLLYGKRGQVYEAIQELESAVKVNSSHFPAVKNLAVLYQKAGFRNKAAEMWERALVVAPDEATKQGIKQHLLKLL
jgi:DNA-binding response OmpR family regulator